MILKWIKDWQQNPKGKVAKILPELKRLGLDIRIAGGRTPIGGGGIVVFFNTISKWHDRHMEIGQIIVMLEAVNYGQHTEMIGKLNLLRTHFQNAGRDPYGWNRTQKGQEVTAEDVYLGNIFGLFTHPVSYWIQRRDEKKGGWCWPGMEHLNSYDVVGEQAQAFINSHVSPISEIVYWLEDHLAGVKAA